MTMAMLFGGIGGYIKLLIARVRSNVSFDNQIAIVTVGCFIGLLSYFALESQMLLKLMYQDLPDEPITVTYKGIVLIAALSGFLSVELSGFISDKANRHFSEGKNGDGDSLFEK